MYGYIEKSPQFDTPRFIVAPLSPSTARALMEILLQDEALAARVPWMDDKSMDGALREAFGIELQCVAGRVHVWGVIARDQRMQIGAIIARDSLEGVNVEVLVASHFWNNGIADEASEPVIEWISDSSAYSWAQVH